MTDAECRMTNGKEGNPGKDVPRPTLVFYTKSNCPLCDEALAVVRAAQERLDFTVEQVNIYGDPTLYEQYKHDIPVATLGGHEVFRHRADVAALEDAVKQAIGG